MKEIRPFGVGMIAAAYAPQDAWKVGTIAFGTQHFCYSIPVLTAHASLYFLFSLFFNFIIIIFFVVVVVVVALSRHHCSTTKTAQLPPGWSMPLRAFLFRYINSRMEPAY